MILGIDLGSKTMGLSISDKLNILARELTTYRFEEFDYDSCIDYIKELKKTYEFSEIVLGLPKHMNNDLSDMSYNVLKFKDMLTNNNFIVHLEDERRSSVSVLNSLKLTNNTKKYKAKKDEFASCIILQKYLDKINR